MKPLHDYVLIEPIGDKSESGLVVPRDSTGVVLAQGDGCKLSLKGYNVYFSMEFAVELEGKFLVKEEKIICQLNK